MDLYSRAKFEVSSAILSSCRRGGGGRVGEGGSVLGVVKEGGF